MKTLNFGIEIETVGQTRKKVAEAVKSIVGGSVQHVGTPFHYDPWMVKDSKGRKWQVMADSSLGNYPKNKQAEIVSPILKYEDIEELQDVIRAVKKAGAKVDDTCGIHIHVDGQRFNAKQVINLVKIVNKQENLIYKAIGIKDNRKSRYAKPVNQEFLRKIENSRPRNMQEINKAWYGRENLQPQHYDHTRYYALNLHNIWYRGTIEWRVFNSTLHAGKVKAYIQFVLAISAKAMNSRTTSSRKREFNPTTAKYDFRVFMLHLGFIGDEFKTARKHLLANLEGSSAWKNGRPQSQAA